MRFISTYHLNSYEWILFFLAALLIGMSKAGISSISIISVTICAWILGSKESTGVVLPMLILADILAVSYYKRHAVWYHLIKLMPWVVLGVIIAAGVGQYIDALAFKQLMSAIILISIVALFYWEKKSNASVPTHQLFATSMGLATGFTSMIGNLAGGFSNVYFLSMRLAKENFIGTVAWLFFMLNLIKLPFHIFYWHTITKTSLQINGILIPAILIGFFLGVRLVKKMSDGLFRQVILWLTMISSLLILLGL